MKPNLLRGRHPLSKWVTIWFVLDWLVALLPPIHWGVALARPDVLGLPATLAYFLGISAFIGASVAFAYWVDARNGCIV